MLNIFKYVLVSNRLGFRKSKSILAILMVYYSDLVQSISKGIPIDAVHIDIRKLFDTVNIDILVNKLNTSGVHDTILSWFKYYLSNRTQQTKIKI